MSRASSARHSRVASHRHRPCPTIWASSFPLLAKVSRCVVKRSLLFEAVKNRRLVDSDLLRRFTGAAISCLLTVSLAYFHLREVFNAQEQYKPKSFLPQAAVYNLLFWHNFGLKSPENLQEL